MPRYETDIKNLISASNDFLMSEKGMGNLIF